MSAVAATPTAVPIDEAGAVRRGSEAKAATANAVAGAAAVRISVGTHVKAKVKVTARANVSGTATENMYAKKMVAVATPSSTAEAETADTTIHLYTCYAPRRLHTNLTKAELEIRKPHR